MTNIKIRSSLLNDNADQEKTEYLDDYVKETDTTVDDNIVLVDGDFGTGDDVTSHPDF